MRRSHQVAAPLLAATALSLLSACRRQPEMQRCVDENNRVVADTLCQMQPGQTQPYRTGGGMGFIPMYRYYYGGVGGFGLGSIVTGGSYGSLAGHSYSTGTTRGGFGSSHGGGEVGAGE